MIRWLFGRREAPSSASLSAAFAEGVRVQADVSRAVLLQAASREHAMGWPRSAHALRAAAEHLNHAVVPVPREYRT